MLTLAEDFQNIIEKLDELIMSSQDYVKLNIHSPYKYSIQSAAQYLYYFGDNHSSNPEDPQYNQLFLFWDEFLASTASQNRLVFIEGGLRSLRASLDEAIIQNSTAGCIVYLAAQNGVEVQSPDPNDQEFRKLLDPEFSRDEIQYYFFARMIAQWHRKKQLGISFEEYMSKSLATDKKQSSWEDYDFSLTNMFHVHRKLFGSEFDLNDVKFFKDIGNPHLNTRVNFVSRKISRLRDQQIVLSILEALENGTNLFCVFGHGHAIVQEPALRELIR
ncbi:MAG: hypothetical protein OHK0017_11860 [Patescibacteria group bacterium]